MLIVILHKKTLSQGGLFLQKNIIINHHQKILITRFKMKCPAIY